MSLVHSVLCSLIPMCPRHYFPSVLYVPSAQCSISAKFLQSYVLCLMFPLSYDLSVLCSLSLLISNLNGPKNVSLDQSLLYNILKMVDRPAFVSHHLSLTVHAIQPFTSIHTLMEGAIMQDASLFVSHTSPSKLITWAINMG